VAGARDSCAGLDEPGGAGLVSVVIPCFNQAHFLAEAIESALAQTYAPLEVIVVDDGSSDNSCEVAGRYTRVKRLRQANSGVAVARNAGLRLAAGEFLVFLDADDRLLPHAVEVGMRALVKRPQVAFVAGTCRDIGVDGRVLGGERQALVTQDHYQRLLLDCFIWSGSSVVYRRAALESVGAFDEHLRAADDYDLYLKLAHQYPVFCHDTVVTEYRRHGANTTRDAGVVLRTELAVLDAQRSVVRTRRERRARRAGIRRARRAHGRALASQIASEWHEGRRRRALTDLSTLVRMAPRNLLDLAEGPAQ
jgi:Glycosyl transferase family 2